MEETNYLTIFTTRNEKKEFISYSCPCGKSFPNIEKIKTHVRETHKSAIGDIKEKPC